MTHHPLAKNMFQNKFQKFLQPVLVAVQLAALMTLAACGGGGNSERSQETLTAVVDAGSTGSRIYLYKTTPDDSFIQIKQLYTNKDVPHGLSWYDGTQGADSAPGNAGASGIEPLLSKLQV